MSRTSTDEALLDSCKSAIDQGHALHHAFLVRFEQETLSDEQLGRFAIQWYKTARAHREAFPWLIANIKDEEIRFDLVEILAEEYGDGERTRMHARLLQRLLLALDLTLEDVECTASLRAVVQFESEISAIWRSGEHPRAFGLQFGLEYLASAMQLHFARGLAKYPFLTEHDREYFDLHAEAEIRHIRASEHGFIHYGRQPSGREMLFDGVRTAEFLLASLWDELDMHIFRAALESRTS